MVGTNAPTFCSSRKIGMTMKSIGTTLLILGVGTIVLNFAGFEFRVLSWIDMWGETVGWAIRAAIIVAGAVVFFLGWRTEQSVSAPAPRQEPTMEPPTTQAPLFEPAAPEPAADPTRPPEQS